MPILVPKHAAGRLGGSTGVLYPHGTGAPFLFFGCVLLSVLPAQASLFDDFTYLMVRVAGFFCFRSWGCVAHDLFSFLSHTH